MFAVLLRNRTAYPPLLKKLASGVLQSGIDNPRPNHRRRVTRSTIFGMPSPKEDWMLFSWGHDGQTDEQKAEKKNTSSSVHLMQSESLRNGR
jgi:hypothetical protein